MTDFTKAVIVTLLKVPKGKVATYKQIAELSGKAHAVRAVSWILHSNSKTHKLPWQRIINSKGQIAFPWGSRDYNRQKNLLKKEGVTFLENGEIDLIRHQWRPRKTQPKRTVRSSIA